MYPAMFNKTQNIDYNIHILTNAIQNAYNGIIKYIKGVLDMAQINIRVDDNLKEEAEKLFNALGLNFSSAVNIFISQAVREGGLPFVVTTRVGNDPFYSDENMARLRKSIERMESMEGIGCKIPSEE